MVPTTTGQRIDGVNRWQSAIVQRTVLCDSRAVYSRTVGQNGGRMTTNVVGPIDQRTNLESTKLMPATVDGLSPRTSVVTERPGPPTQSEVTNWIPTKNPVKTT